MDMARVEVAGDQLTVQLDGMDKLGPSRADWIFHVGRPDTIEQPAEAVTSK